MIREHSITTRSFVFLLLFLSGLAGGARVAAQQATSIDRHNYALILELPYLLNPAAPATSQYLVPGVEVRDYDHATVLPINSFERRVRQLDDEGRVVDTHVETITVRYDRTGRLLETQTIARDPNGRVLFDESWRFNYSTRGAAPINADLAGAGGQSGIVQFNYDATGRLIRIARTDGYAVSRQDEIRYLNGKLTERIVSVDETQTEHHRYLYEASGLLRAVRLTVESPVRRYTGWWYWD